MIPKRFERLTHALEGRCSIQLSYGTILICGCKGSAFYEEAYGKVVDMLLEQRMKAKANKDWATIRFPEPKEATWRFHL